MEAAAARGGTLSAVSPRPPPGKEWRAVTEEGPLDVDFCSITIDGGRHSDDLLEQINNVSRQREELQRMEIELKAQAVSRSDIMEMQNSYESRIKEHADAAARLKEQLKEREQHIRNLELKLEEKERELRAVKTDNEAAWAKEEATLRRERDNSETERTNHLQQIHDLQEHIRDKENQFCSLQEQYRTAQDTIVYKDEQLREAQTWIARVQEMGAMTNQSLQAELREHIEQFNQYYIGFQRQFMEMERHHLQAIQQLRMELAEARERNGVSSESSQGAHGKSADTSAEGNKGNQSDLSVSSTVNGNSGYAGNGNSDSAISFLSSANTSTKAEHASSMPLLSPSILGIGSFIPHGQMASLHPCIVPQAIQQSAPSTNLLIAQSHVGHGLTVPTVTDQQHWQSQQGTSDVLQMPLDNKNQLYQTEQNLVRSDAHYINASIERQAAHVDYINNNNNQQRSDLVMNRTNENVQVFDSNSKDYQAPQESQETLTTDSRFHGSLEFDKPTQKSEIPDDTAAMLSQLEKQTLPHGQQLSGSDAAVSASEISSINSDNSSDHNVNIARANDISDSASRVSSSVKHGKVMDSNLLDERCLLACIVRAIPAGRGSGIRISTTLTNRLAKLLTPLHWHDYKKHYGELDEFVGHHPELFVTDGDFIRLREGAHEIIAATTAVAKVAAAASSAPYPSFFSSVAVTPIAQIDSHKKTPSADSGTRNVVQYTEAPATCAGDLVGKVSHTSKLTTHPNGVSLNIIQGMSDLKILSKSKDLHEANRLPNEVKPSHASLPVTPGTGQKLDKSGSISSDGKDRQEFGGRRYVVAGAISRR